MVVVLLLLVGVGGVFVVGVGDILVGDVDLTKTENLM